MKNLLIFIFCLFSFLSFAKAADVEVINAEYGVPDHLGNRSLCVTAVRLPGKGVLLGVVESIQDCFYARQARKSSNRIIRLDLRRLRPVGIPALNAHLQSLDSHLKFLFSDGE